MHKQKKNQKKVNESFLYSVSFRYFHTSVQLKCHEENKKSNDSFSTDKLCENIPNELNEITTEIFSAIKSGNIDEALRVYQKVSITDGFHETDIVYLTLLNGLLNSKRIDDAKVIVTEFNREKGKIRATNESEKVLCNIFGEDLEVDDYLWFVDNVIFTRKYCNRRICEIIIRTMLTKYDNFDVAFDLFERIAGQFEMTSMLHQIACECIRRDDADRLKEILEISKKLHGKSNSFLDIAFAFISCDRAEQAKRLFMSLESDAALTNRVTHFVENLKSRRETKCLHDLLNATENFVSTECRAEMYSELLVLYAHENDSNAVIRELLSSMDKEEIVPDHKNLERIRKLLQKKEIEAPKSWLKVKSKDETVATLESHLVENDIEKANKLFYMCLESGTALPRNVIRYCLQKNAENGHIDIFVNLNGKFDVSTKMQIKFHAYECVAYTKAGECKKYIKLVESACNEKNADLKQLAINISERIINMIEADPDVYESCKWFSSHKSKFIFVFFQVNTINQIRLNWNTFFLKFQM